MTALRAPVSRWDHCISAADQLMQWHARTTGQHQVLAEPVRTRTVVLLAACLDDRADAAGLDGAAIAQVQISEAVPVLDRYALSALESCRTVPAATGGDVVDELLTLYGQPAYDEIRHAVRTGLTHHLADGGPHVRIIDRRQALRSVNAPHLPESWESTEY